MAGPFTLIPTEVLQDRNMQQITDFGLDQTTLAANSGWDDLEGPIAIAGGLASLTNEAYGDTDFPFYFFNCTQDDKLFFIIQTKHRWDLVTPLKFHLHVIPMANPAAPQVIKISGTYAWFQYGKATPIASAWTAYSAVHTVNPGDIRVPTIIPLITTTVPADVKPSDFLLVRVIRPGSSDAADTYSTAKPGSGTANCNVALESGDAHYYSDKPGTVAEYGP